MLVGGESTISTFSRTYLTADQIRKRLDLLHDGGRVYLVRAGAGRQHTGQLDAEPGAGDENERHRQDPENLFHPPHDKNP